MYFLGCVLAAASGPWHLMFLPTGLLGNLVAFSQKSYAGYRGFHWFTASGSLPFFLEHLTALTSMTYRCDHNMLPQTFKSKFMSRGGFESHKMGLCGLFLCSSYTHYYMINIKTFLILILLLIIIVTVPLALEDLVPVLKSILQDESPVAIRQACSSLKVNTSCHLQTLH